MHSIVIWTAKNLCPTICGGAKPHNINRRPPLIIDKQKFGKSGEDLASSFLQNKGYKIIERNFRFSRNGEIDIIAKKNDFVLFVEVKNRSTEKYGGALYSINSKKKNALRLAANQFIIQNPSLDSKNITFRFDLIAVEGNSVEWVEDIIR